MDAKPRTLNRGVAVGGLVSHHGAMNKAIGLAASFALIGAMTSKVIAAPRVVPFNLDRK